MILKLIFVEKNDWIIYQKAVNQIIHIHFGLNIFRKDWLILVIWVKFYMLYLDMCFAHLQYNSKQEHSDLYLLIWLDVYLCQSMEKILIGNEAIIVNLKN